MSRTGVSRRITSFVLLAGLLAVPFAGLAVVLTTQPAGAAITNFTDGSIGIVGGLVSGGDGALWFTNQNRDSIGRYNGTLTQYTGTGISQPTGIALGPDNALWFTNKGNDSIGRIDESTHVVTNYTGTGIDHPTGIAAGPDGNMWFTNDVAAGSIGMIDLSNDTVSNFTSGGFSGTQNPNAITAGPDGRMWFTNDGNNSIGAILTNGSGSIFNWSNGTVDNPQGIAPGPDGALWFTNEDNNSIGRIDTSGTITNFTDPGISSPVGIAAVGGPGGALWFGNSSNVGRITTSGHIEYYNSDENTLINPTLIATGPDAALWFTNPGRSNAIGRIAPEVVSNFTDASISHPGGITTGPDGALWFVNETTDSIGRIDTSGVVTNYTGTNISLPYGIITGPDGALWFTNLGNDSIGRIDPSTHAVTNYTDASISGPLNIVTGSDGALWFPNEGNDSIGRITTSGVVTNFTDLSISQPSNIAAGPDGALWFTNQGSSTIGRIDPGTHAVTNYTDASISNPTGITSGPDGALWFVNNGTDSIGRITTAGVVTNYTDASISGPSHIVAGPDGALWFTNSAGNSIGRITTGGTVSNYTGTGISDPYYITTGPDGALWFTNFTNNSIGRITPVGAITVIAVPGASSPGSITAGPVGDPNSLWFVNAGDTTIARMTTGGTVTNKFPTGQLVNRITSGSDGALWFTAPFDNGIGRMDTSGNVNYYPSGLPTVSWADGITAGPDGDLWYTDNDNPGSIGQMDTSGNVIGNYTDPGHLQDLNQIIAGPDGGLWFTTNNGNSSVGRIDPVTHAITYVTDPSLNGVNGFNGLAAGPDGAVWALNTNAHSISRIDPGTETVTAVYTDPLLTTFAFALTAGGDGALWFIDLSRSSIGRMTTDGTVTETPDPNMNNPTYMTQGPDGALYYTNGTNNSVSRADPNGVANAPTAVGGTRGNGQVSLSWTAPANTGALSVTDYSVSVFNSSGGTATGVTGGTTRLVGSATPNLVFSGLTNGTAYTFKVAAVNSAGTGTLSALSAPVTPFTVPGAPTVTSVTPGNGQLALTWNAPVDDGGSAVTDYAVSVFDSVGGPATGVTGPATRLVGSAATSYAFTGLTNGTRYEFAVAAVNAAGTGAQSALTGGNYPSSFSVPAMLPNPGSAGFDSGYRVNNSVTVSSVGQWSPFGGPQNNWGAGGSGFAAPAGSLLPGATGQYALVGRIGTSGAWTLIGYGPVTLNGHGELFLAMNDQIGQFADNSGSLQISLAALDGVTGTTPPVSATLTSGYEAAWSVPIINDSGSPLTSVSATVTASKNGSTPLAFDTSLMLPLCVPGAGSSLVCPVPDVPAHSTYLFNVYVPTTSLVNGDTVTGTVAVTAAGGLSASGNLGTVAIVNCGTSCVVAVAPPGVPIPSSPAPTTPTDPPQQTVTVPASQAGSTPEPVAVTLSTIAPAAEVGSDLKLCPTATGQTQCSGPISSVVADFSKFNDPANPIAVKIVTDWGTTVPAGRMLMEKKTGGDPLFLLACVKNLFTLQYNTPCLKSETVTGTTNKITTDTIFMTGLDVHFARRTATGGTVISPPAAPTALTVNPGALKATLHWRAPTVTNGAGVTSYVVTVLAGGVVKKTIIYPSPLLTETVTALLNGTAYTFKVAAGNVAGTSVASVVSTAIKVGTPSAPTAVTATAGHTAVTLRWTAPAANGTAAVNGYVITPYVAGIAKPAHTYNTTATTETITGLTTNTNYTFKVAAKNAIGTGPQSPPTPAIKPT